MAGHGGPAGSRPASSACLFGCPQGEEAPPSELPPGQCRTLKAASLPGLVRHLLEAPALGDPCFVPAFLATFRTFAAPRLALEHLLDR